MNGRLLACFPVSSPVTPVTEAGRKHASNFYDSMGGLADAACWGATDDATAYAVGFGCYGS
jgi:hypothetical protein